MSKQDQGKDCTANSIGNGHECESKAKRENVMLIKSLHSGKQEQENGCKFDGHVVCIVYSRPYRGTEWDLVSKYMVNVYIIHKKRTAWFVGNIINIS